MSPLPKTTDKFGSGQNDFFLKSSEMTVDGEFSLEMVIKIHGLRFFRSCNYQIYKSPLSIANLDINEAKSEVGEG